MTGRACNGTVHAAAANPFSAYKAGYSVEVSK